MSGDISSQTDIRAAFARIFFNQMDLARIEREAEAKGNPNYGTLNDAGIHVMRQSIKSLVDFKDRSPDDFLAACTYFGPYAMCRLAMHMAGQEEFFELKPLLIAFARIAGPSLTNETARAKINEFGSLNIKNPQVSMATSVRDRVKEIFEAADPDPAKIEDTGDGFMLMVGANDYCDFGPKNFCGRLFAASMEALKDPNLSPQQYAHAALILESACRLLPENGCDPFSRNSSPTPQAMIRSSIDRFYAKREDHAIVAALTGVAEDLERLPNQAMATYPSRFAADIYGDAHGRKVYQALEHDENFELSGALSRLHQLLSHRPQ